MLAGGSLQLFHELGAFKKYGVDRHPGQIKRPVIRTSRLHVLRLHLFSHALQDDPWIPHLSEIVPRPTQRHPSRNNDFICKSFLTPVQPNDTPILKAAASALTRSFKYFHGTPIVIQMVPAIGVVAFSLWGLEPLVRLCRNLLLHRSGSWKKSSTYYIFASYLQPLLLWTGVNLICRALDPVFLPSVTSQVVKQRLLTFIRSLSTVLTFAHCLSSLMQHAQKFFMGTNGSDDAQNTGFQFAGKALYSAVWIAAASLFMELLGFSTQKWITAGGLGTVLLTLAGREIFTNFLSSVMIHATRPFIVNEWIQTNIDGYEVSGMVEHVGWWSPTIIRGDDREAIHVPNHKFTVNVVRNLSQRTHWRIKAQLAISHLDVDKINNVVADMRKVLAKNPHVEQQKLHRRVFLEGIDPENQSLLILVSCFVKTPHVDEYFCVKEGILLDLLRVISHHHARLATPIRTIHNMYADTNLENIKFGETIFSNGKATSQHPLLLIEPKSRINSEDKSKAHSMHENEKQDAREPAMQDSTAISSVSGISGQSGSGIELLKEANPKDASAEQGFTEGNPPTVLPPTLTKPLEDLDFSGKKMAASPAVSHAKHEKERPQVAAPPLSTRASLEDNIVLGVALEGLKRTLPIDEELGVNPDPVETKEVAKCGNGNGNSSKDKKENQGVSVPGDQRDCPER